MKITRVTECPCEERTLRDLEIGDTFEKANVKHPENVYLLLPSIGRVKGDKRVVFGLKYPCVVHLDADTPVTKLCAELVVAEDKS